MSRYTWLLALLPFFFSPAAAQAADVAVSAPTSLEAAQARRPTGQVALHPATLLVNRLHLEYEQQLRPSWSLVVAPKVGLGRLSSMEVFRALGRSFGVDVGARWFPAGQALSGFFIQPGISYDHFFGPNYAGDLSGLHFNVGHQWVVGGRALISLAAGVQYNVFVTTRGQGPGAWRDARELLSGFLPSGGIGVGFGF